MSRTGFDRLASILCRALGRAWEMPAAESEPPPTPIRPPVRATTMLPPPGYVEEKRRAS